MVRSARGMHRNDVPIAAATTRPTTADPSSPATTARRTRTESHTESLRISIENITLETADLQLAWEKTAIQLPIVFPTSKIMESNLSKMNVDTASANDLYTAAVYYLNNDKDLQKAKVWITKAVALKDDAFCFYRQKSLIHEALGELKMAIDAAQRSLELAESGGNQQYVNLNKKQLREWTER